MSEPDTTRQRLFFALWPEAAVQQRIAYWAEQCAKSCGGKRVPDENMHLTLVFLGGVTPEQRGCLEAVADEVTVTSFDLTLDRIGYWSRSRTLWLSTSNTSPELLELAMALRAAMSLCGLKVEERPFRTHLTLRRRAHRGPRFREINPIVWHATDFALVASETHPEGARYQVLRRWRLVASGE
ncbi:RNA 2',3'-cyclic phosphodiesterase [Thiohalomonas denitrificans]|uniref:RNA 2',3'-cyclic phosphodiesterase n=1 Tax=Thiohalomonas denitrificans TaxID=415747 RepID=A0A1G5PJU2_9GAMM|nr:RNA 2',3'-cyclic phosphodiesterase [Thiohalomonas denitrificans]SCZ49676.1 2'-5' RNA ligase [Thiohalomonas denitrificans]